MLMLMNLSTMVGLEPVISEPLFARGFLRRLHEAQKHGKEGKQADANEEDGDGDNRRMHSLPFQSGNWGERSAPKVTNAPQVLPNRDEQRQDTA